MAFAIDKYFSLENQRDPVLIEVAKTIRELYPIGINAYSPEYHEYPGIKKIKALMAENIGNNKNYNKIWSSLLKKLRKESGKEINSTTYGVGPGFSGDLVLEKYEDQSLIRVKRIAFAVSLIGPFYSICGVDETFIKDEGKSYHAINVVTTSPYKEFEGAFNGIKYGIENQFKDYRLVPFLACVQSLKDLDVLNSHRQEGTVYGALFNHLFDYYNYSFPILRGDSVYGYDKSKFPKVALTASAQEIRLRSPANPLHTGLARGRHKYCVSTKGPKLFNKGPM